jgi:flavodoxin
VVVPYAAAMRKSLDLPADRKALLKLDLHYSHTDAKVLKFCDDNNFIIVYVPGGCTDELQECDRVGNKPFKAALKKAYRDWLFGEWTTWQEKGPEDTEVFTPKLTMGSMKPLMLGFVDSGIRALQTADMKEVIRCSFSNDGRFAKIRSADFQERCFIEALQDDEQDKLSSEQLRLSGYEVHGEAEDEDRAVEVPEDTVFEISIHPGMYDSDADSDDHLAEEGNTGEDSESTDDA